MTEYVAEGEYRKEAMKLISIFHLLIVRERHTAEQKGERLLDMEPLKHVFPGGLEMWAVGKATMNGRVPMVGTMIMANGWMANIVEKKGSKPGYLRVTGNTEAFERDMMLRKFYHQF